MMDKAIEHGKEHRKPYYRYCERIDKTCRPGGDCPVCYGNRMHKHKRHEPMMEVDDADVYL
jgi:hypothetical protein